MDEYLLFEAFERGDYIPQESIKKITNYICGQLICWSPNPVTMRGNIIMRLNYKLSVNGSNNKAYQL